MTAAGPGAVGQADRGEGAVAVDRHAGRLLGVASSCWVIGATLGSLAGLRPEQANTPRRGDRPLGECLAAAAEKEQAEPHVGSAVRRSTRCGRACGRARPDRGPAKAVAPAAPRVRLASWSRSGRRSSRFVRSSRSTCGTTLPWRRRTPSSRRATPTDFPDDPHPDRTRDDRAGPRRGDLGTLRVLGPDASTGTRSASTGSTLPLADNLDLVDLDLAVAPEHQRRGHGRVLLDHALQRQRRARPAPGARLSQRAGRPVAEPRDAVRGRRRREPFPRRDAPHPRPGPPSTSTGSLPCAPRPSEPPRATTWCPGPATARTTSSTTTPP